MQPTNQKFLPVVPILTRSIICAVKTKKLLNYLNAMGETLICPRVIWKVDLSFLNSSSRSYCQSIHILKSFWKLVIEKDEEWDEYKIHIMPENPEVYLNMHFFVQCGVRDKYGICRFEFSQTTSTENLLMCNVWGTSRRLLLEENLIQKDLLWVVCTVEPESSWEDCKSLTDSISMYIFVLYLNLFMLDMFIIYTVSGCF